MRAFGKPSLPTSIKDTLMTKKIMIKEGKKYSLRGNGIILGDFLHSHRSFQKSDMESTFYDWLVEKGHATHSELLQ